MLLQLACQFSSANNISYRILRYSSHRRTKKDVIKWKDTWVNKNCQYNATNKTVNPIPKACQVFDPPWAPCTWSVSRASVIIIIRWFVLWCVDRTHLSILRSFVLRSSRHWLVSRRRMSQHALTSSDRSSNSAQCRHIVRPSAHRCATRTLIITPIFAVLSWKLVTSALTNVHVNVGTCTHCRCRVVWPYGTDRQTDGQTGKTRNAAYCY